MAVYYRSQGFILSKDDLREADQIFNIYTKDFGKLKILGRAIRKIKSKLRSGAELFYLSEIEFIQGKNYKTLTDAFALDKFKNIRNDLEKLETAYKITELTDSFIRGQEPDREIWNLLNEVFQKLNDKLNDKSSITKIPRSRIFWHADCSLFAVNCSLIYYYFLWNFLSISGFQIDPYNCAFCHKKLLPKNLYFNPEEGGIICSGCASRVKSAESVSPEFIKILRIFLQKDWSILSRLKIGETYKRELESISENYLLYIKTSQNI